MIKRQKKPMRSLGRRENWKEGSCHYYRRGGSGRNGISRIQGGTEYIYSMGRCPVVDNTAGVRFLRKVRLELAGGSSLGYNETPKSRHRRNV